MVDNNGWYEYKNEILTEIKRLSHNIDNLQDKVDSLIEKYYSLDVEISKLSVEVNHLRSRSSVWSAVAGSIVLISSILIYILMEYFKKG